MKTFLKFLTALAVIIIALILATYSCILLVMSSIVANIFGFILMLLTIFGLVVFLKNFIDNHL